MKVTVPEELFRAKKSGTLLPFFGAGVSAALGVPSWARLLKAISEKINCSDNLKERINSLEWDTNFEELSDIASKLTIASGDIQVFMNFLQEALKPEISGDMPERYKVVSELRDDLPGVVTTNFDTILEDHCGFTLEEIIYRDYKDVLMNLQQRKFLFKIHGDPTKPHLMVFTKEQYQALEDDKAYQEVLKQIFLRWAIIFVGYSITDTYILKNLEYLHRNFVDELEVFALLPDAEFELQKRLRRIGVRVIPYAVGTGITAHSAVDAFLALLESSDFIPAPESGFQGRIIEIERINKALVNSKAVLVEIIGPAGIGKTQLARAAAQNIRQEQGMNNTFSTSIFVDLRNQKGASSLIFGIRDALGLSEEITEKDEIFNEVSARRALIIADNVEDPLRQEKELKTEFLDTLFQLLMKLEGNGALILTTRTSISEEVGSDFLDNVNALTINLGPLNYEEARELFILESKAEAISEKGEKLLNRLSTNPGSIRILGRRAAKLSDEGKENLYKSLLEDPEKASKAVINTTFELLPEDSRLALQIALAFPAGLSPKVAQFKIGDKFTELLAPALTNGLLIRSGGRYRSIESIRQMISSDEITRKTLIEAIDFYLKEINSFQNEMRSGIYKPSNATFLLEEYANISACANIAEKFDHLKLQELTPAICLFFDWAGLLEDPTRWIRTVYTSEVISSHDTGILILFANNLARFGGPENNALAEKIYKRILEHYDKVAELTSLSRKRIIQASDSLAFLLMNVGGKINLQEAEILFRNALQMKRKYDNNSIEDQREIAKTADALANLLLIFQGETNLREAESLIRESYAINKKLAEGDSRLKFNLARSMLSLSRLLQKYGEAEKMPEIETLCREALTIHKEIATFIPGAKTALVESLVQYANVLVLQKKVEKSQDIEEMYREAIKIQREIVKTQPSMQRGLASSLYSLAIHLRTQGEHYFKEAETLQREALMIFEDISEKMPSALEGLAYNLIQLATFIKDYGDKEKLSEAESLIRKSLSITTRLEEMGISTSKLKVQNLFTLAQLFRIIGGTEKLDQAEDLYHQIINIMREEAQYLPRSRLSIASMNVTLAELIMIKGGAKNLTEAISLYQESIKIQEDLMDQIPELKINLAMIKLNYANFLHNFGREDYYNQTLSLYQDALKTTKALVELNPQIRGLMAHILYYYANFIASKGGIQSMKMAESLLRESIQIYRDFTQESKDLKVNLSNALTSLGSILRMMGDSTNLSEIEKCYREALSIQQELNKTSHGLKIDITTTATDLANILINLGGVQRFAEAENLLRDTVEINRDQIEHNPLAEINLARTLGVLADLLSKINVPEKLIEAEKFYTNSIDMFRKRIKEFPGSKGDLAISLLNFSSFLLRLRNPLKFAETEKCLIEALSIFKENISNIPNAEMNLYKTKIALVELYQQSAKKEKVKEAKIYCRDALTYLKNQRDMPGIEIAIMDTSYKLANIILLGEGNQKYNEVELILREALAYARTNLIDTPQFQALFARIEYGLAFVLTILRTRENLIEAEDHFKNAINIQRKLASDFPDVKTEYLKSLFSLAELSTQFRTKDKLIQAEILYKEVLIMLRTNSQLSTTSNSDIVNIEVKLADVLTLLGNTEKLSEIEELLRDALVILRKMNETLPEMRINIANVQHKLAQALSSQIKSRKNDKIDEIESLMDETIQIYEEEVKKTPGLMVNLGECIFFLAASLHLYGPPEKHEKAESKYREVMNLFGKMEQTPDMKTRALRISVQLTELLDKMNRFDDAELLYQESLRMAKELVELKPEITEYLGKLTYGYALFLKKNYVSSAREKIVSLLQEAKVIFRKLGKEDLLKSVEQTEKESS